MLDQRRGGETHESIESCRRHRGGGLKNEGPLYSERDDESIRLRMWCQIKTETTIKNTSTLPFRLSCLSANRRMKSAYPPRRVRDNVIRILSDSSLVPMMRALVRTTPALFDDSNTFLFQNFRQRSDYLYDRVMTNSYTCCHGSHFL